jgi:hypothetical protein
VRVSSVLAFRPIAPVFFRGHQLGIFCFFFVLSSLSFSAHGQQRSVPGDRPVWHWKGDAEADTHLLEAVDQGDPNKVRELLKSGANPNSRQKGGGLWSDTTALCLAVALSTSYRNLTPHSRLSPKYEEIVEALVEKGADATECSLTNVGDVKILRLCLAHGADPNNGNPLNFALGEWRNHVTYWMEVIRALLQAGADPNWESPTKGSRSLFFSALASAWPEPIFGPPKLPDLPGTKPMPTNTADYEALVQLLIQHGARINERWVYLQDRACGYPIIAGTQSGLTCSTYYDAAHACGPSPQTCPADRIERVDTGVTPLIQASRLEFGLPIVKALLSNGADPTLKDSDNCTALDGAKTPAIRAVLENAVRSRNGDASALPPPTCRPSRAGGVTFKTGPPAVNKGTTVDKIDFFCFKGVGAQRQSTDYSAKTAFGDKQLLDVTLEDPAGLLSKSAKDEITRELLFAISVWRKTCTKCKEGNASVVVINDSTYINERFLGVAKSIDYEHANVGGKYLSTTVPTPYSSPLFEGRLVNFGSLPQYVMVAGTDPSIQRLCSVPSDKLPLDLLGLREAFRCGTPAVSPSISLKIRVLNGDTKCSPAYPPKLVVGCEAGNLEIEFNARRFGYITHVTSKPIFGNGADTVDLQAVLLHEMGHWAGIRGHLKSSNNIMSTYVQDCKCIDDAVIQELAKTTTAPQASEDVALLYRRGSPSQQKNR